MHCSEQHRFERQKPPLSYYCLRCFWAVPQEVLHKLGLWGRNTVALRPEAKTSLALQEGSKKWRGKTCSRFLTADCSQRAWGTLLTCLCKAYYSGFYLTPYHTTGKLQEDHTSWCCAWSFFEETGKWKWFDVYTLQTTHTLILHQFGISLM